MISWWNERLKYFWWNITEASTKISCCHKFNTQKNAIALTANQVCELKSWSFNALLWYYWAVKKHFWFKQSVLGHDVLAWLFELIGGAQQSFCWFYKEIKRIFLLGNWRKGCLKPKALCNNILAGHSGREGKVQHWQLVCHLSRVGFALDT